MNIFFSIFFHFDHFSVNILDDAGDHIEWGFQVLLIKFQKLNLRAFRGERRLVCCAFNAALENVRFPARILRRRPGRLVTVLLDHLLDLALQTLHFLTILGFLGVRFVLLVYRVINIIINNYTYIDIYTGIDWVLFT